MSRLVYLPYEFLKNETPDNVYYKAFLEGCATQLECFITSCYLSSLAILTRQKERLGRFLLALLTQVFFRGSVVFYEKHRNWLRKLCAILQFSRKYT